MDYDARGFASAADGTRLFYGLRGKGPGVVLVDGIGCDGWAWNHIQPHLAQRHRVLHVHYRGHGRSAHPPEGPKSTAIETLSDDLARAMDAADMGQAVLCGHSMGTQVLLELQRTQPQRARALILICGGYGRVTHTFHGSDLLHRVLPTLVSNVRRRRRLANALWGRLPPALAYKVATWIGEIDGGALRPEDFRQYVEHLSDIDLDLYLNMLQQAGEHSAEDLLGQIRVPTLVIAAEKDNFTPRDVVKATADRIPNSEYMELAGASHAAPGERAEAINARIDQFLTAHHLDDGPAPPSPRVESP